MIIVTTVTKFVLNIFNGLSEVLGNVGAIRIRRPQNTCVLRHRLVPNHHKHPAVQYYPISSFSCSWSFTEQTGPEKLCSEAFAAIAYFSLMRHGPHRKLRLQQFFFAARACLPSCCLAKMAWYTDIPTGSSLIRHRSHRKRYVQQFFYCCEYSLTRERFHRVVA
jgi:hypothetical protein